MATDYLKLVRDNLDAALAQASEAVGTLNSKIKEMERERAKAQSEYDNLLRTKAIMEGKTPGAPGKGGRGGKRGPRSTGISAKVHDAIKSGVDTAEGITRSLGLSVSQVYNSINGLKRAGRIAATGVKGKYRISG